MKDKDINAFLGKGTEFDGKLIFNGTVRIDGQLKGEVSAAEGKLIVGELGRVDADIHVSYIVVNGEIYGNIIADHKIDIFPSGKVFGSIQTPTLSIQDGAIFEGDVKMSPTEETERELTAIDSEEHISDISRPLGTIRGVVLGDITRPNSSLYDIFTAKENTKKGEPIKDAKIFAECKGVGKRKTKTDSFGRYELAGLEDGKWDLKLKAKGYDEIKAIVEISGGGEYEQNFL
ncbi:polymer-forming cytoskeletal protein [Thermodesulfobacteriota bacterium]